MANMNIIKEREMLYTEKHCLSEKHVYQTLLVLTLLFLIAGNIISQSYYIEYAYCEFINVIIRVIISRYGIYTYYIRFCFDTFFIGNILIKS